jgi:3-oxoacyl-[acyl-carrier protein] reductase
MPGRTPVSGAASLEGKRAVVTGAARGIGAECALALAGAGAEIVAWDVLDTSATVDQVQARGGKATGGRVDVTQRAAVRRAVEFAAADGIDVLVTAAGIYGNATAIEDLDEAEVDAVLDVNFKGTMWCVQAALPTLRQGGASVVCVGSEAGKIGGLLAGPHYVASKGAIHAFVRWLAKIGAPDGIRANGVAPGAVDTDMTRGRGYSPDYCPLQRLGEPEDIAQAVLYLASPASSYVTGIVLDVNGGHFVGA